VLDGQPVWLRAVESILRDEGVVPVATSAPGEALELLEREQVDVLIVGGDTFDWAAFLRRAREVAPAAKAILVSVDEDPRAVHRALDLGADAYVVRRAQASDLVFAVRQVLSPEVYHVRPTVDVRPEASEPQPNLPKLTARERQILALVAEGRSNAQIAQALDIREPTVKGHLWRLYRKIGVPNRTAAARWIAQSTRNASD